jgi:hypothetical protein
MVTSCEKKPMSIGEHALHHRHHSRYELADGLSHHGDQRDISGGRMVCSSSA